MYDTQSLDCEFLAAAAGASSLVQGLNHNLSMMCNSDLVREYLLQKILTYVPIHGARNVCWILWPLNGCCIHRPKVCVKWPKQSECGVYSSDTGCNESMTYTDILSAASEEYSAWITILLPDLLERTIPKRGMCDSL